MHPKFLSKCWNIAFQCRQVARRRNHTMASTSSLPPSRPNPFPFPLHRNPTPYQIFHLPSSATANDIKDRYFQLVRLYHPDKVGTSTSSDIAHTRFQAITAAYDILTGKAPSNTSEASGSGSVNVPFQTTASWRAMRKRRQELYDSGPINDGKSDNLIIIGVVATVAIALFQIATLRHEALKDLLSRTREPSTHAEQHRRQAAAMDERLSLNKKQNPDEVWPIWTACCLLLICISKKCFFLKCRIMHPCLEPKMSPSPYWLIFYTSFHCGIYRYVSNCL